jgi:hypothetical protein
MVYGTRSHLIRNAEHQRDARQAADGTRADDLVKETPYRLAGVMSAASAGDGAVSTQPGAPGAASGGSRRRWLILAVIATAQLMVVLDMTVVNIARYLTSHLALAGGRPGTTLTSLALIHGYTTAFWWAAGILVAGAVICGTLLRPGVLAGQGDSQPDTPARHPGQPARSQPSGRRGSS